MQYFKCINKQVCVNINNIISFFPASDLEHMELDNNTHISKFFLLGFSEEPELQPLIFGLFVSMYLITIFGNLFIMLAVRSDPRLHTPMYFFLSNLSFVDICFTSTTIQRCCGTSRPRAKLSLMKAVLHRFIFSYFLQYWTSFSLLWWPMTALWPFATPCITQSS